MMSKIKDIIIREFKELEKYYKFKIQDEKGFIKHLIEDLIEDENEVDISNKYSQEDIENIEYSIKDEEETLKIYENKLKDCYKVLEYFKEATNEYQI